MFFVRKTLIISDMNATELIRKEIERLSAGEPFTPRTFLNYGTRAAVDQILSRLSKAGWITRVTRGVYVHPIENPYIGKVSPDPFKVAQAKANGAILQVNGAEAARHLELTTQVPTQPVFYTNGPSKRFRIENLTVVLKHVSQNKLALANRPAGLALSALFYLGKREVTPTVIETIRKKLSPQEFHALKSATRVMPAWMAEVFLQYERRTQHA